MNIKSKSLLLVLLITILVMAMNVITADAYVGSIFTYTYEGQTITYEVLSEPNETENGTAKLIYAEGVNKNLTGAVIIPATVTNQRMIYNVIQIDPIVFMDAKNITSITLPETITAIGEDAFRNCSGLTGINIPQGVARIETGTFFGCSSLINMDLPYRLTYIGDKAFSECSNLISINIPESLTYIGSFAFSDCSNLTGIYLPKGMKYLGAGAFSGCSRLTKINIPEGITAIGHMTFQDCISLTSVDLPEGISSIGYDAFSNCKSLTSIHLSDDITSIGESAFYMCSSLTEIKIPNGVSKIEKYTFLGCSSLSRLRISDNVTSIGDFAFVNCKGLLSINLPDRLTSIGNWSFYGCDNLRPITIPAGVTSIGEGEFPYSGVLVYKNSYAEAFFQKNFPMYYQIIEQPIEGMFFSENSMNIGAGETVTLKPVFYPNASPDQSIRWRSSNPSVVSVDAGGTIRGFIAGEADITAEMGKYSAVCHIIVGGETVNPTAIGFAQNNITINKGEYEKIQLIFTPANASERGITWTSSDNSVVTVENGIIFAKNTGTAVITAKSAISTAECKITVYNPLKEIFTDYDKLTLNKGETRRVAVSYNPVDTTDNKTITWKSEDESIAKVANGVITAVKPGSTIITATVGAFTHSIPVVVQIPIKSLSLSQREISLTAGQTQILPLVVFPADTSDDIKITSSDKSVATYSGGNINALKRGKTTITVTGGSFTASCLVTVDSDIKSIKLNKTSLSMFMGGSETLAITFNPATAVDDKTITWVSSDKSVLQVDLNGKVKAVGTGTATITASAGVNKTAACSVNVKLSVPASFKTVSASHNSVKISWGSVSGASGYRVYRATSAKGTFEMIKDTTADNFTNTGLTTGSTYYYKVRGYHYQGTEKVFSSYTAVVNVKPIPSTPANVKLVKTNATMINFTWNQVSGASGYEVYRYSSKTPGAQLVKTTTSLHFMNSGLSKGRIYYYKVRAYKLVGKVKVYSKFSAEFSMKI